MLVDPCNAKDEPFVAKPSSPFTCLFCNSDAASGIYVEPLSFRNLEQAIECRKTELSSKSGNKRGREDDCEHNAEASFLVYSQGKKSITGSSSDADGQRTGRWTEEEIAYVDHLVTSFDQGQLPIPAGTKLSVFLGDMLLCKPSRLTKKMKNAKLSTRSFEINIPTTEINKEDFEVLSILQKRFIDTMPTEASQLELDFNITRQWRAFFSDLCVQVGYQFLDVSDWIASLEDLERKTTSAEKEMRNIRRRKMGFHLRHDTSPTPSEANHPPQIITQQAFSNRPAPSYSDDLDNAFMSLMEDGLGCKNSNDLSCSKYPALTKSRDPFLQTIAMYIEENNLPFQHADVWVPSFVKKEAPGESVQLLHAGHVTRSDQMSDQAFSALENFGEYSKAFAFEPGQGLPGRAYSTNKVHWEFQLSELDPVVFARKDGAKAYGVKTATAVPLTTAEVGRMVVVFYSCNHISEDAALADRCSAALAKYSPQPKWKLVIEIDPNAHEVKTSPSDAVAFGSDLATNSQQSPILQAAGGATDHPAVSSECDFSDGQIISLLGDQLSSIHGTPTGESTSSAEKQNLLPHFMSIRLLLLRPSEKRSQEENEMIEILRSSFKAYSQTNSRSGEELAKILAHEWVCLKSCFLPSDASQAMGQLLHPSTTQNNHQVGLSLDPMDQSVGHSSARSSPVISIDTAHKSHQLLPVLNPSDAALGKAMAGPPSSLSLTLLDRHKSGIMTYDHALKRPVSQISLDNFITSRPSFI